MKKKAIKTVTRHESSAEDRSIRKKRPLKYKAIISVKVLFNTKLGLKRKAKSAGRTYPEYLRDVLQKAV
jgi:hypothetical protein